MYTNPVTAIQGISNEPIFIGGSVYKLVNRNTSSGPSKKRFFVSILDFLLDKGILFIPTVRGRPFIHENALID